MDNIYHCLSPEKPTWCQSVHAVTVDIMCRWRVGHRLLITSNDSWSLKDSSWLLLFCVPKPTPRITLPPLIDFWRLPSHKTIGFGFPATRHPQLQKTWANADPREHRSFPSHRCKSMQIHLVQSGHRLRNCMMRRGTMQCGWWHWT